MACEDGGADEEKCGNALMPMVQGMDVIRYPSASLEVQGMSLLRVKCENMFNADDVIEGALYEYGGSPSCRTDRVFPDGS